MKKNTKYTQTNTNESMHSEMGPVRQNPIQRTVTTAHLSVLTTVHSFSTRCNKFLLSAVTTLAIPSGESSVQKR